MIKYLKILKGKSFTPRWNTALKKSNTYSQQTYDVVSTSIRRLYDVADGVL